MAAFVARRMLRNVSVVDLEASRSGSRIILLVLQSRRPALGCHAIETTETRAKDLDNQEHPLHKAVGAALLWERVGVD